MTICGICGGSPDGVTGTDDHCPAGTARSFSCYERALRKALARVDRARVDADERIDTYDQALRDTQRRVLEVAAERDEFKRERDAHRAALNKIADLLHVVHEDDKIVSKVLDLYDRFGLLLQGEREGFRAARAEAEEYKRQRDELHTKVTAFEADKAERNSEAAQRFRARYGELLLRARVEDMKGVLARGPVDLDAATRNLAAYRDVMPANNHIWDEVQALIDDVELWRRYARACNEYIAEVDAAAERDKERRKYGR